MDRLPLAPPHNFIVDGETNEKAKQSTQHVKKMNMWAHTDQGLGGSNPFSPDPLPGSVILNEDVADILRELCEGIFIEQPASWFTDTTTWAQDRSFDVFCRWF